jgi:endonuclease/exonuclease/phosphatase family metal-dependent hydrolase
VARRLDSKLAILLAAVALLALALPTVAVAHRDGGKRDRDRGHGGSKVTVMTRNVFLGADLSPAIAAASIPEAIDGAGEIWNEFQSTNFPERAVPLAREIKRTKPDLVGLQEVALWRQQTPSDGGAAPISPLPGATPATEVVQDFLAILLEELNDVGARYEVVVAQDEFDGELPVDADGSDATGTGPLAGLGADFDARLTMRDVILARKGSKVELGETAQAHYVTRYEPNVGGIVIPVDRGWVSVEAEVGRSDFRFVNTHLEAFGDPTIRESQAKELIAGPLTTDEQVILVGDLNSGVERHNEPEQPGDDLAFRALEAFGMTDNGAVQTCCYSDLFDATQVFDHTVDHVLTKPGLRTKEAFVTGNDPAERTPSGLWPSDHGGVVSRLELTTHDWRHEWVWHRR